MIYDNIKIDESKLPEKDILFRNKKKSINQYKKLFINIVVKSALYLEDDLNKSNIYTDLLNSEIDYFLNNSDYKNNPEDYVIATGEEHSVREFVEKSFSKKGINIKWIGEGENEANAMLSRDYRAPYLLPDVI